MLKMAMVTGNQKLVNRIIENTMGELTHELTGVAMEYNAGDLPLVIATMKIAARFLERFLDDGAKSFVQSMMEHTTTMVVDYDELKRQMREQEGDGED